MLSQDKVCTINSALDKVLSDRRFKSSPLMSAFLSYIVKQTLDGQAHRIKAYNVAVDALGKAPSFDPQKNPSVRVLAKRLRTALDDYYNEVGSTSTRIEVKPGSYVPHFLFSSSNNTSTAITVVHAEPGVIHKKTMPIWRKIRLSIVQYLGKDLPIKTINKKSIVTGTLLSFFVMTAVSGVLFLMSSSKTHLNNMSGSIKNTEISVLENKQIVLRLASGKYHLSPYQRPHIPTVTIMSDQSEDPLIYAATRMFEGSMSQYEYVRVNDNKQPRLPGQTIWPEDYSLKLSTLNHQHPAKIAVELIHHATGEVSYTQSLAIDSTSTDQASNNMINAVVMLGKSLVQTNGVILHDYRKRGNYTPTMRCAFLLDDYYWDKTSENREALHDCTEQLPPQS